MPGHRFFLVSQSSNRLREAFHEPGHIRQTLSLLFQTGRVVANLIEFEFGRFFRRSILPPSLRKKVPPPESHLFIRPRFDKIGPRSSHHMQVVTHDRKAEHINSKNPCQYFQSIANPLFAMRIVPASFFIPPAQIRSTHAAIHQMKHLNLVVRKDLHPIHPWHNGHSRQSQRIPPNSQ